MLNRAKKGFTLLELIVVIVILGILAALAIPTFQAVIERSEDQSAITAAEAVGRNAVAQAAFDNERDPARVVTHADVISAAGETGGEVTVTSTAFNSSNQATLLVDGQSVLLTLPTAANGAVDAEMAPAATTAP